MADQKEVHTKCTATGHSAYTQEHCASITFSHDAGSALQMCNYRLQLIPFPVLPHHNAHSVDLQMTRVGLLSTQQLTQLTCDLLMTRIGWLVTGEKS